MNIQLDIIILHRNSVGKKEKNMVRLMLSFLGAIEIKLDGVPVTRFKTNKVRALLVYLVLERNRPHRRQSLAGLLWPDFPETRARTNLRHALANLRNALGDRENDPAFILVVGDTIRFNPESDFWLDVAELEEVVSGADSPIEVLEAAIDLFRDPFLDGFSLRDCPEFDNWTAITRQGYQELFSDALRRLVKDCADQGDYDQAIDYVRRWLEGVPWEETAHRELMQLFALNGQRVAALAQFETCKQSLSEELGVEPSIKTVQLYEQIRDGEIAPKERGRRRGVLPVRLTSFIGREKEVEQVTALLGSHRMVTVTGPGGIGKSRLVLKVARQIEGQYRDSAWWVELAPLVDPELVPETVVRVLGIHLESREKALDSLRFYLEDRRLLLVLDNCEHLVETCAQLADALLRTSPHLSILATSREPLGIQGESIYSLPPMDIPDEAESRDLDCLVDIEAFRLFTDRAMVVSPKFEVNSENAQTISRICSQVDGIPLAIELASARVRMMGVDEIARRLEDRFQLLTGGSRIALPRYQTLRASIDWSYVLLSEMERTLLQRLSVFGGRWTLEGAEYVSSGDGIETNQVLDLFGQLVSKSLVTTTRDADNGTTYRMLETIRQYAHEKLVEAGGFEAARDRHLRYYVDLTERLEKLIRSPEQGTNLRRLETELDDIRLALGWALQDVGDLHWKIEQGLRLVVALHWFWHIRGRSEEGLEWLEPLLERQEEQRNEQKPIGESYEPAREMIRAKALMVTGLGALQLGDRIKGIDLLTKSRNLYSKIGSEGRLGYAWASMRLGIWLSIQGEANQAEEYLQDSLFIFQEFGDRLGQGESLGALGEIALYHGEFDRAKNYYEKSLTYFREIGDQEAVAYHLWLLGRVPFRQSKALDPTLEAQAIALFNESHNIFTQIGNIVAACNPILLLGELEWMRGNVEKAKDFFNQILSHGQTHGYLWDIINGFSLLGGLALSQGDYQLAAEFIDKMQAISLKRGKKLYISFSLIGLGDLAWEMNDCNQADQKYRAALKICQEIGYKPGEAQSQLGLGRVFLTRGKTDLARTYLKNAIVCSQGAVNTKPG